MVVVSQPWVDSEIVVGGGGGGGGGCSGISTVSDIEVDRPIVSPVLIIISFANCETELFRTSQNLSLLYS